MAAPSKKSSFKPRASTCKGEELGFEEKLGRKMRARGLDSQELKRNEE